MHDIDKLLKSGVKLPKKISCEDSKTRKQVADVVCLNVSNDLTICYLCIHFQAGVCVFRYDGCVECNKHVWHQDDKSDTCPICEKPTRNAGPFVSK